MRPSTDKSSFRVHRADWGLERDALRLVRARVFVQEQGVPAELEWDGEDEQAVHLLAVDAGERPIGTARLLPTGQIGRMAVLPDWRGRGVGSALLRALLDIAREDGRPPPFLHAQTTAVPFYLRSGFKPVGEVHLEAGLPHQTMIQIPDLSQCVLGETAGGFALSGQAAIRAAGIHMAAQARRELLLFSHDLDPALYDDRAFLDEMHRVALRGHAVPVRILVLHAEPAIRKGHRLIDMARHLSSKIQIRRIPAEFNRHTESYLLADGHGYVLRPLADVFEGSADFNAPLEVRRLHEQFEHIWALGEIHQELRRLYL